VGKGDNDAKCESRVECHRLRSCEVIGELIGDSEVLHTCVISCDCADCAVERLHISSTARDRSNFTAA
jgi:hypothetical protein